MPDSTSDLLLYWGFFQLLGVSDLHGVRIIIRQKSNLCNLYQMARCVGPGDFFFGLVSFSNNMEFRPSNGQSYKYECVVQITDIKSIFRHCVIMHLTTFATMA